MFRPYILNPHITVAEASRFGDLICLTPVYIRQPCQAGGLAR